MSLLTWLTALTILLVAMVLLLGPATSVAAGPPNYDWEGWRLSWPDRTTGGFPGTKMWITTGYGVGDHVAATNNYYAVDFAQAGSDYPLDHWPVLAVANGTITCVCFNSQAGNYIEIRHDDG